jgi:ABC-type sugar transport system ATPase subunit
MIELRDLSIRAGDCRLSKLSLQVPTGKYAVLMGKTGQGKTLLLESICGLRSVERGRILLDGFDMTFSSPAARRVGYVPQDLALFSTMTVQEHLAFALRIRRAPKAEILHRVEELAALLNIEHLLQRRPRGLSGGESQRVALGRALSFRPSLLLLDEPLSALDEATRDDIQSLLRTIQSTTGVTTLHVTHNRDEASALADLMFILSDGCIMQVAPPGSVP